MKKNDLPNFISSWVEANQIEHQHFETIDSTNLFSKRLATKNLSSLYLVTASQQTAGKGRNSNTWSCEPNDGLLSSWNFFIDFTPPPIFSVLVGLSLIKSLGYAWPQIPFALKAPNDIYVSNKKIAGLLIENIITQNVDKNKTQCHLIIGLGFNLFDSPLELATSILEQSKDLTQHELSTFLSDFLMHVKKYIELLKNNKLDWSFTEKEILTYLNKFEGLQDTYINLTQDGTLHTQTVAKNWFDL